MMSGLLSSSGLLTLGLLLAGVPGCTPEAPAPPEPRYAVLAPADPSDELFAAENLIRFDLELPPDSLRSLEQDPYSYARGTLHYRDQTLESIGVRLKGESSFRALDDKPAFRLKLDEFASGQRLFGLKRL